VTGAAVHACSLVLAHAPDLVRHGSKPARELAVDQDGLLGSLSGALRTYEEAVAYPPHQVLLGNLRPDALWEIERPWWRNPVAAKREGPFGVVIDEEELYRRMVEADAFGLFKLDANEPHDGALAIFQRGRVAGSMKQAHDLDESLSASVLLENLACKTTGALALEHVLRTTGFPPEELPYVIGSGEEAVGELTQNLLENPLFNQAVVAALSAGERALQAQRSAMTALNIPSSGEIERLERRLRSLSDRLEAVEDQLDEISGEVHGLRKRLGQDAPTDQARPTIPNRGERS